MRRYTYRYAGNMRVSTFLVARIGLLDRYPRTEFHVVSCKTKIVPMNFPLFTKLYAVTRSEPSCLEFLGASVESWSLTYKSMEKIRMQNKI